MLFAAMLLQTTPDPQTVQRMVMTIIPLLLILFVVCLLIVILPFWFICRKAGFSPWLSLLNIVPFGNLILIYVLAFADWKVMPVSQLAWPPPPPYPQQPPFPPQA